MGEPEKCDGRRPPSHIFVDDLWFLKHISPEELERVLESVRPKCPNIFNIKLITGTMQWESIKETPPEQMLEVRDEFGNEAYAEPCYFPFRVEPDPENPRTWGSKIIPCEPEWDGSWMVQAKGLENPLKGPVVEWRKIEQDV